MSGLRGLRACSWPGCGAGARRLARPCRRRRPRCRRICACTRWPRSPGRSSANRRSSGCTPGDEDGGGEVAELGAPGFGVGVLELIRADRNDLVKQRKAEITEVDDLGAHILWVGQLLADPDNDLWIERLRARRSGDDGDVERVRPQISRRCSPPGQRDFRPASGGACGTEVPDDPLSAKIIDVSNPSTLSAALATFVRGCSAADCAQDPAALSSVQFRRFHRRRDRRHVWSIGR